MKDRTVDCKEHGEQLAIMVDAVLCRYKCKKCLEDQKGAVENEKDRG